jgi:NAD dependent epimerase/dehydratase family enzyme
VNATAPTPVSQLEFAQTLGRVLRRPAIAPLPAFVARSVFGRLADPLLLEGVFVSPSRLEAVDFRFETPTLESCLRTLLEGTPPA